MDRNLEGGGEGRREESILRGEGGKKDNNERVGTRQATIISRNAWESEAVAEGS